MGADWRQQEENEERRWYEEGPGSDTWKQHMRYMAELEEMQAESAKASKRLRRPVRWDYEPF